MDAITTAVPPTPRATAPPPPRWACPSDPEPTWTRRDPRTPAAAAGTASASRTPSGSPCAPAPHPATPPGPARTVDTRMNAQTRCEVRTREIRTWTRASSSPRPSPFRHPRAPRPRLSPVRDPRAPVTTRRLWRRSSTRPRRRAPIEPMSWCCRCLYNHPRIPRRGPWRRRRWSAAWRACSWSWSERRRPADLYRPTTRTARDRRTGRTAYTPWRRCPPSGTASGRVPRRACRS
mmetsp:Transcript_6880/g.31028  ORF Transcript_6880/g.31028 Transcript_6880/m.31028 type:complete len:234 (+) Transcript_6880:1320-2021(+)